MLGVFGNLPTLLLFLWGLFSIGICALSLGTLLVTHFIEYLPAAERRPYYLYACFNLVPGGSMGYSTYGQNANSNTTRLLLKAY